LILLLPWLLSFVVFWAYPFFYSLYLSFTQFSGFGTPEWTGLSNYLALLNDNDFITSVRNTIVFAAGTIPATTVFGLGLALLVNGNVGWRGFYRAGFFLPSVTSMVVIALVFQILYSRGGYLYLLARSVGLPVPENGFLLSTSTALPAIMAMDVWVFSGYYMVFFLAGLQAIPAEYYEHARLEGATFWQRLRHVTLPLLRPIMLFVVVVNTIKTLQVFVEIFIMTKGGPLNSTMTVVYDLYETGLRKFRMGYASAMAYVLFVIIMALALLQMKVMRSEEEVQG
jgi:multiple sugar transport system permease protein